MLGRKTAMEEKATLFAKFMMAMIQFYEVNQPPLGRPWNGLTYLGVFERRQNISPFWETYPRIGLITNLPHASGVSDLLFFLSQESRSVRCIR